MWRRAAVVRVVDDVARAQRRERRQAELESLVLGVLWTAWGVRVELLFLAGLLAVERLTASAVGPVGGIVLAAVPVAGALAWAPSRAAVLRLLRAMHVRRAWGRATIDAGVAE